MGHVTGALWWKCTPIWAGGNNKISGQTGHKAHNFFSPVARQPALTWQAFCTQIVARWLKSYHPSTKRIRSPSTEFWHILAVYSMMCLYDLNHWRIFTKIGSRDKEGMLNLCAYLEVCRRFRFWNIRPQNADFVAPLLGNRRCHGNH